jgi:hypothetical protein
MNRHVDLFQGEVKQAVHVQLMDTVKEINQELMKVAAQKGLAKHISQDQMNEDCKKLLDRLKVIYDENLEKFNLYSNRNIFSTPAGSVAMTASSSSSSNPELLALREKYIKLHGEYSRLSIECKDYELLSKDMRETLFALRVASQVFDDYNINPIAQTCLNHAQQKSNLLDLYDTANGLLDEVEAVRKAGKQGKKTLANTISGGSASVTIVNGGEDRERGSAAMIENAGVDDIQLLAKSIG